MCELNVISISGFESTM